MEQNNHYVYIAPKLVKDASQILYEMLKKHITCENCNDGIINTPFLYCKKCNKYKCKIHFTMGENFCSHNKENLEENSAVIKELMDKIELSCEYCKQDCKLSEYNLHLNSCSELMNCPLCLNNHTKLKKQELPSKINNLLEQNIDFMPNYQNQQLINENK